MPRFALALLAASALLFSFSLTASTAFAQDDSAGEAAMLARINELRAAQGMAPLARDGQLDQAARAHSHDMADHQQLMHVSETSGSPTDRVHAAGLGIDEIAENVAMHSDTAQAEATLEASPPHLANMLNPRFTHVGLAAILHTDGTYITQVFGRIDGASAPAPVAVAPVAPALPPPSVASPADAPTTATVTVTPPVTSAPTATGTAVVVPPSSSGVVTVPPARPGVAGYWVCGSGRWWYYPIPAGAGSGTQLQPDLSVSGPPAGYATTSCGGGTYAVAPRATAPTTTVLSPPPPRRSSPIIVQPGLVIGPWGGGVRVEVAPAPMYAPAPVYVTPPRVYGRPRGRWRRY